MDIRSEIELFTPGCEQEQRDKAQMLSWLDSTPDPFTRANTVGHFSASSWIVSPDRQQVLLIYHNIYRSWAWTGGHADGERDLLAVALREAREESGLETLRVLKDGIFSLETLTVDGHIKRGSYVSSHLHLNVTYLLEADPREPLRMKPDENSGVAWFPVSQVAERVTEPWMNRWVYQKLMERVRIGRVIWRNTWNFYPSPSRKCWSAALRSRTLSTSLATPT